MGGDEGETIPYIELGELEEGSEAWRATSKKVREACESHGCFVLACTKMGRGREAREEMLKDMKRLFDLPEHTKKKYRSPKPFSSYHAKCPVLPLTESFGIHDVPVPLIDTAHAFTHLMWPLGNLSFCERMKVMSREMLELNLVVLKMILEGLGLPKHYVSEAEKMTSSSNLRLMKYKVPSTSSLQDQHQEPALVPHTDKNALTILSQNDVAGLQVLSKQGHWLPLTLPPQSHCFTLIVGDILKAWSNGRLHAATHRVMMSGDKERYSFGLFVMPKEDMQIEVPPELVDTDHPLRYRPFTYGQYMDYYASCLDDNALEIIAGV